MFCFLHKWLISQAQDSGKSIPKSTRRHLSLCRTCNEFVNLCHRFENKTAQDKPLYAPPNLSALEKKISSRLHAATIPSSHPTRRFALAPMLVATSLVLAISIGVFLLKGPSSNSARILPQLSQVTLAPASLTEAMIKVESPLETEMRAWHQTMTSTADFLRSCLDIQLGGQEPE